METNQGHAGMLLRESQFQVRYSDEALGHPARAISLTMPVRPTGYSSNRIPPVYGMRLPEGYVLNWLHEQYGKSIDTRDELNLLALVGTPTMGRSYVTNPETPERPSTRGISLGDLIPARGTEDLFEELLQRYSLNTAISGIQPKVLVPGEHKGSIADKSWVRTPDLIVKNDAGEYPGIAENEFHCMSICRAAGLEVPTFHLSEDRALFIVERFDIDETGNYSGFEEVCALMGRPGDQKYLGSYAMAAKAIALNSAPALRLESLDRFFSQLVLCCLLRNGDAHLKNWGLSYGDPVTAPTDARLSPVYDMVCTTVYLPKDTLALSVYGSKAWPDRRSLERFGREHCNVAHPDSTIDRLRNLVSRYSPLEATSIWVSMKRELDAAVTQLA